MADILIVEDENEMAGVVGCFLVTEGYHVRPASSLESTLAAVEGCSPDLKLLDIVLASTTDARFSKRLAAHVASLARPRAGPTPFEGDATSQAQRTPC